MARRAADLRAEGAFEERSRVVAYLVAKIVEAGKVQRRGKLSAAELKMLDRRLTAVAEEINQGMHLCDG